MHHCFAQRTNLLWVGGAFRGTLGRPQSGLLVIRIREFRSTGTAVSSLGDCHFIGFGRPDFCELLDVSDRRSKYAVSTCDGHRSVRPRLRLGRHTADSEETLDASLRVAHYVVLRIDVASFAVVGILTSGLQGSPPPRH
jgi:hypothetical protein